MDAGSLGEFALRQSLVFRSAADECAERDGDGIVVFHSTELYPFGYATRKGEPDIWGCL